MHIKTNSNFFLIHASTDWVFIAEVKSVYSAVRTEYLYNTDTFRP